MKPRAVSARLAGSIEKGQFQALPGLHKEHEIRFHELPLGQAERALALLSRLDDLQVSLVSPFSVKVSYVIVDHTLEALEQALAAQGFHLDSSLYAKLVRALVYYCEEIQLHNLLSPQRLIKKSNEAYVKAWAQHPHGDHDDTPEELRHDK